jgi:hypothetical protein
LDWKVFRVNDMILFAWIHFYIIILDIFIANLINMEDKS